MKEIKKAVGNAIYSPFEGDGLVFFQITVFTFQVTVIDIAYNPHFSEGWFMRLSTTFDGPETVLHVLEKTRRLFNVPDEQFARVIKQVQFGADILLEVEEVCFIKINIVL